MTIPMNRQVGDSAAGYPLCFLASDIRIWARDEVLPFKRIGPSVRQSYLDGDVMVAVG